jgi:hypothetical protein
MASKAPSRPQVISTAEADARSCLEERAGRPFSDREWQAMRDRLCAYVCLLRSWEDQALNSSLPPSRRGSVNGSHASPDDL